MTKYRERNSDRGCSTADQITDGTRRRRRIRLRRVPIGQRRWFRRIQWEGCQLSIGTARSSLVAVGKCHGHDPQYHSQRQNRGVQKGKNQWVGPTLWNCSSSTVGAFSASSKSTASPTDPLTKDMPPLLVTESKSPSVPKEVPSSHKGTGRNWKATWQNQTFRTEKVIWPEAAISQLCESNKWQPRKRNDGIGASWTAKKATRRI